MIVYNEPFEFLTHKVDRHYSTMGMVDGRLIKLPYKKLERLLRKKLKAMGMKENENFCFEDDWNPDNHRVFLYVYGVTEQKYDEFKAYFKYLKTVYYNDKLYFLLATIR